MSIQDLFGGGRDNIHQSRDELGALIDQCNLPAVRSNLSSFVRDSLQVGCTIIRALNGAKLLPLIGFVVILIFLWRIIDIAAFNLLHGRPLCPHGGLSQRHI